MKPNKEEPSSRVCSSSARRASASLLDDDRRSVPAAFATAGRGRTSASAGRTDRRRPRRRTARRPEVAGEMRRVLERVDAREPDVRVVPRRRVHELLRDVEARVRRARVPRGARRERGGVAVRAPDVHDALAGAGDEPREAAKRLRGRHEEARVVARVGGGRIGNGVGGDAREPAGRALQPRGGTRTGRGRRSRTRSPRAPPRRRTRGGRGRHAARLGARATETTTRRTGARSRSRRALGGRISARARVDDDCRRIGATTGRVRDKSRIALARPPPSPPLARCR